MRQHIVNAMITADRAGSGFPDYSELVDAVLAALAAPTAVMLAAAVDLGPNATLREQWRAMVEAAGK